MQPPLTMCCVSMSRKMLECTGWEAATVRRSRAGQPPPLVSMAREASATLDITLGYSDMLNGTSSPGCGAAGISGAAAAGIVRAGDCSGLSSLWIVLMRTLLLLLRMRRSRLQQGSRR